MKLFLSIFLILAMQHKEASSQSLAGYPSLQYPQLPNTNLIEEICKQIYGTLQNNSEDAIYGTLLNNTEDATTSGSRYSCPPTVTWGGGNQIYRFVKAQEFTRCEGQIAKCVYHAHLKYYCFSGRGPSDYQPKEMFPHYEIESIEPEQNVTIGPFGEDRAGQTPFDFRTSYDPILAWKLCPTNWVHRLVVQGIEVENSGGSWETAGECETLPGFPPTEFHLGLGDYITEAFGRIGSWLDRLTFIVTPSAEGEYPSVYSAGGPFGKPFDATPKPSEDGACVLVDVFGSTLDGFINTIGFKWSCIGVPDSFY